MDNFTNKLRILTEDNASYQTLFAQAGLPDLELTDNNAEADIVLAAPPLLADSLDEFKRLDWVQSAFAGVDALMAPGLRQDYQLTNVRGIFGQQIAEYVLGHSIAHLRHFGAYQQQQQQKQWQPLPYQTLSGRKLMILGCGSIGRELARAAGALGLHTIGVNRTGIPPRESTFDEVVHIEQLHDRLPEADILVSTLPGTPQTKGMFNQAFFACCRNVLFFNVGRGDAVVTQALLNALQGRQVEHAFLDVFINEPISQQCPYWSNPKVTVTPHIAAYSFPDQVFAIFCDNYQRWRDGFSLQHLVDFDKGY
jgi:phosphoglycerate dehydrogenase-like enzyme